ncbi:hypothetical protein [Fluviicola sp.]|uniref:hypothetical protein n=1 Tax=Fluviicola sp. TaxID=1917219 RepID=UPI0031E4766E
MARDIKLDCYHFTFRKQLHNGDYFFRDFLNSFNPDGQTLTLQNQYNSFYTDLVNYFGSEFRINVNETKGITISSEDTYLIQSNFNIVSGVLRGGDTGIGKKIQERRNSLGGNQVDQTKIHAIPHYFQIWMPIDLNFCIVVVQSYTGESLSGMFLQQLGNYFKAKNIITYNRQKFLPQRMIDDFRNNAIVKSVTFKSSRLERQKRQAINPVLVEKDMLNVELTLKGFGRNSSWAQFREWLTGSNQNLLGIDMSDVNLDNPVDRIVEYNYKGKTTKGKLTKEYQIIPSIVISDEIQLNEEKHPDFNSIHAYVCEFMNELIVESGYDRND